MLRSHRSTPEKLWSIGLRIGKGPSSRRTVPPTRALMCHPRAHQQSWRSFSSGGLIKEQPPSSEPETPTTRDPDGNVLVSAAKEAQRLSDLAAKCRPEKDKPPPKPPRWMEPSAALTSVHKRDVDEATIQSALEAAQALLFVTRLSSPLQEAIQNRETAVPEIQKQITSLHRAFMAVTSWCLDVVTVSNQPDPRMLDMSLQIARRAHQLQLPFHMPLYIRLMNVVAEHYDPPRHSRTTAGAMILEIAGRATTMLGPDAIESSHFFRDPLEALTRRRCFGDVAAVLRGIETQYRTLELDKGTLLKLLLTLELTVQEDSSNNNWEETADVLEILNLADPYLWKTITALQSLSDIWNRKQDQKRQEQEQIRRSLIEAKQREQPPPETTTETQTLLPTLPSQSAEDNNTTRPMRRKRCTESYQKKDDLYIFRMWIYQTTSPSEHEILPDITAQIEALYDGKDFRYGEDLEREILKRQMDDDDEEEVSQK